MKRLILLVSALFLLAVVGGSVAPLPALGPPAHLKTVVEGNSTFALELYGRLKGREGNLFLSPYSISSAMAIAYAGARGDTETQIAATMHFGADQRKLHAAMAEIRRTLAGSAVAAKLELTIASGLWPQRDYDFRRDFLELAQQNYDAAVEFVDFPSNPAAAAGKINGWIARQTKNKITAAVPSRAVTEQTRLVIANAIYFKGDWASQFPQGQTAPAAFWLTPESS